MKFDLIIVGGGTSGVACAYIAAKKGLHTLLVEKTDVLGGAITQGLVVPSMKVDTNGINCEFFTDLKAFAAKYDANYTYIDSNDAWFNPELLKIVLDDMLSSVNCNILYSTQVQNITKESCYNVTLLHKMLSIYCKMKVKTNKQLLLDLY